MDTLYPIRSRIKKGREIRNNSKLGKRKGNQQKEEKKGEDRMTEKEDSKTIKAVP